MDSMHQEILARLSSRFEAYSDLSGLFSENLLNRKIDVPKHKSLAEHLLCVVGARDSYAKAIEEGEWSGFACSIQSFVPTEFRSKLDESAGAVNEAIRSGGAWTPERSSLLATLAEHEVMHEGQIIRHMYALEQELPGSWVWA